MPEKKTGITAKRIVRAKPPVTRAKLPVTHEQIAERAYVKFVARGRQPGREMQDWLEAERELLVEAAPPGRRSTKA